MPGDAQRSVTVAAGDTLLALAVTHWDGQGRVCGSVNAAPRAVNAFADARQTGVNDG